MLVAFSVAPSGSGNEDGSVSEAVAAAVRVVRDSGLPHETNAMFTNLEGAIATQRHMGLRRGSML